MTLICFLLDIGSFSLVTSASSFLHFSSSCVFARVNLLNVDQRFSIRVLEDDDDDDAVAVEVFICCWRSSSTWETMGADDDDDDFKYSRIAV